MKNKFYDIDYTDKDGGSTSTLKMLIEQLEELRGTTKYPEELEWEIRLYQFMLKDPQKYLAEYEKTRRTAQGFRPKREVVKILGWEIL